jgi:hypothetical protein
MQKNTCAGWKYQPENRIIDHNNNGDAIGCHLADDSQSWYCSRCRYKDAGELPRCDPKMQSATIQMLLYAPAFRDVIERLKGTHRRSR